jgi:hypothetical protein
MNILNLKEEKNEKMGYVFSDDFFGFAGLYITFPGSTRAWRDVWRVDEDGYEGGSC